MLPVKNITFHENAKHWIVFNKRYLMDGSEIFIAIYSSTVHMTYNRGLKYTHNVPFNISPPNLLYLQTRRNSVLFWG